MNAAEKRARCEQTDLEIDLLWNQIQIWLDHRSRPDHGNPKGQYSTQLRAVAALFSSAAEEIRRRFGAIDPTQPEGRLYQECRWLDQRVLWLRRVWQFYREKFDQRDDDELSPTLRAADEIVWSCYRPVFQLGQHLIPREVRQTPAPLPFLEAFDRPVAFPSQEVPLSLRDSDALDGYLRQLPVSLVRIPPVCVSSPWWLVYLAHEVGHHVQNDLLEKGEMVGLFKSRIESAVRSQEGTQKALRWQAWSEEIFADVFSVVMVGPWALWAMVELVVDEPTKMREDQGSYPPSLVRLALMAEVARQLELDEHAGLRGLKPQELSRDSGPAAADLQLVSTVAAAALASFPELGGIDLPTLCGFNAAHFRAGGSIHRWALVLRGGAKPKAVKDLSTARLITSAALRAWSELLDETAGQVGQIRRRELAEATLKTVEQNRPEGVRSAEQPPRDLPLGKQLADLLLSAEPASFPDGAF